MRTVVPYTVTLHELLARSLCARRQARVNQRFVHMPLHRYYDRRQCVRLLSAAGQASHVLSWRGDWRVDGGADADAARRQVRLGATLVGAADASAAAV